MNRSREPRSGGISVLALAVAVTVAAIPVVALGQAAPKGRIVCWKDKNGKVVGCGDKIPDEYRDSASQELDRRGVTRSTTESAEAAARRQVAEKEAAKAKAEASKRIAEQRRQDAALLSTYTSAKEIDLRRDRDLQQVELQMSQMKVSVKTTTDRYNEVKARADAAGKAKGGVPAALKDELAKAEADKARAEQNMANKEKEKDAIRDRYAGQKKRYLELQGEAAPAKQAGGK